MNIQKMLIIDEGLKLFPYLCTSKFWTIGVGRNLEKNGLTKEEQTSILGKVFGKYELIDILKKTGITQSDALMLLENDINFHKNKLSKFDWFLTLNEPRQSVLINMSINLGFNGLLGFDNFIKSLEYGDMKGAVVHMLDSKWANIDVPKRALRLAKIMESGGWPAKYI